MLEFKNIDLSDKHLIQSLFSKSDFNSEEYSFGFCFIWRDVFNLTAAKVDDFIVIKAQKKNHPATFLFPAGSGDVGKVMHQLMQYCSDNAQPLVFHTILTPQVKLLETLYPHNFEFIQLNDYYDYVYESESLISLAGKKLHSKRTHINRFKESFPDWSFEKITPDNISQVVQMNAQWCKQNDCTHEKSLEQESCAVRMAIENYFELGFDGGLIRANGEIIAFSIGEKLNSDTYLVHIEKAFGEIQGAYAMINQQFATAFCAGFKYINREDDSGQEGLRKAKQSYRPVFLVEKSAGKVIMRDIK